MSLDYAPTIQDLFWSRDPHPGISQIQFRRGDDGRIETFVYRDFDGDGRESFRRTIAPGDAACPEMR